MNDLSARRLRLQRILELEEAVSTEVPADKAAAEVAYALAVICREQGDFAAARRYRDESIRLLERADIQTVEGAAHTKPSWQGVPIPDLIHEGVVRNRLAGLSGEG